MPEQKTSVVVVSNSPATADKPEKPVEVAATDGETKKVEETVKTSPPATGEPAPKKKVKKIAQALYDMAGNNIIYNENS